MPGSRLERFKSNPLFRLLPYLKSYRNPILLGALMVFLTNIAAVALPWILREAIDQIQSAGLRKASLVNFAGLIVGIAILEGIFRFLMRRILIGVSRQIEFDLRNDLFAHLQTLSSRFYQTYATGDIMARATNDLGAVRSVLGPGIMYSINTALTSLLTVSILLGISAKLAALTLLPLIAVSLSVKYFGRQIHRRFERIQEQFSWITTLAQENVAGIRVVKAYNQEKAFIRRFQMANEDYMTRSMSLVRIWGMFQPLLTLLLGLSLVGLLWYGGRLVIEGSITLGDFVAFIAYLSMLTWPTIALGFVINLFERGSASMARINELLDAQSDISEENLNHEVQVGGSISFQDLSFSYNEKPVLSKITFGVGAGDTVAIVGRTGSGKSTLVNLLCKLYPVPDGMILVDGIDINRIPTDTLRRSIGYVPQEAFLFSESIAENIALGRPEASEEQIQEAAATSNVLSDIRGFPDGFNTFVGERGITLSGGQKQRISISRALIAEPKILILDDSLSAVDTQTEEKILNRLNEELRGRTAILISHRISTVKLADQIYVLDDGRIVESGDHRSLLAANGFYADLHRKQLLKEELEIE